MEIESWKTSSSRRLLRHTFQSDIKVLQSLLPPGILQSVLPPCWVYVYVRTWYPTASPGLISKPLGSRRPWRRKSFLTAINIMGIVSVRWLSAFGCVRDCIPSDLVKDSFPATIQVVGTHYLGYWICVLNPWLFHLITWMNSLKKLRKKVTIVYKSWRVGWSFETFF